MRSWWATCWGMDKVAGATLPGMLDCRGAARAAVSGGSIISGQTSSAAPFPPKKKTSSSICTTFLATGNQLHLVHYIYIYILLYEISTMFMCIIFCDYVNYVYIMLTIKSLEKFTICIKKISIKIVIRVILKFCIYTI